MIAAASEGHAAAVRELQFAGARVNCADNVSKVHAVARAFVDVEPAFSPPCSARDDCSDVGCTGRPRDVPP